MKSFISHVLDIFIGLLLMLVIIGISVTFILYFKPLYYSLIQPLKLPGIKGLSYEQIKENYNTLINYNSFFGSNVLSFPYLPSSASALTHFKEVKFIFLGIQLVTVISLIASAVLIIVRNLLKKGCTFLLFSGLFTLFLPAILAVCVAIDFNGVFIFFHKLAFNNNFWIFDEKTDPIILFLPESFFMYCALGIIISTAILSSIFTISYTLLNKKKRTKLPY